MDTIRWALGMGVPSGDLTTLQVCLRALLIYFVGLLLLRLDQNRFLGKATAFDILLGFILGSLLSRAVNGSAPLAPSLVGATVLIALHRGLATLTLRYQRLARVMKGRPEALVLDGEIVWPTMRRYAISRGDLEEALRLKAHLDDPSQVREARFERNGEISVLPGHQKKREKPRVVEVAVREGVQTVRIMLD
jgi:uncharacterized membrane protein YcaP (DUF421 family)